MRAELFLLIQSIIANPEIGVFLVEHPFLQNTVAEIAYHPLQMTLFFPNYPSLGWIPIHNVVLGLPQGILTFQYQFGFEMLKIVQCKLPLLDLIRYVFYK